jgi:protein-S-isoprenylcysteine O-methyltransferase Ste14
MKKDVFVKIGDFFFKYRNLLFPVMLAILFLFKKPAHEYFGSKSLKDLKDFFAITIAFSGLFVRASVIGFAYIKRGGLNKKVYADNLVTEGFFGVCRNPLYVGNLLIYFGVLLMHGQPDVVILGSAFFLFVYFTIVKAEEFFLRDKFGEGFENYCKDVPRWIPKLSNLKNSISGMKFNFKRVIIKDYTTISNTVFALILINLYEHYLYHKNFSITPFALGILGCFILLAAVYVMKKSGYIKA